MKGCLDAESGGQSLTVQTLREDCRRCTPERLDCACFSICSTLTNGPDNWPRQVLLFHHERRELRVQMRRDADFEPCIFSAVTARHDLPDRMDPCNDGGLFLRHAQIQKLTHRTQLRAEFREQRRDSFAGLCRDRHGIGKFVAQTARCRAHH